jgi:hypothetical protein
MDLISYPCKMMNCWFELEFRIRVRAIHCILMYYITWGILLACDHVQWRTVR